ncbi:hypothetical protein LA02_2030 (plasmid) [Francisella philomiragia]|uniref:hypothetical protein n=1 Tax=Francisella philomiragia TaxID=28110 RepID=UPI0005A57776|nr:hypothetical protein [Francisella philomiragia]AJI58117.1 hypothetical protein LA02_2030 [Francisella philomiragia]
MEKVLELTDSVKYRFDNFFKKISLDNIMYRLRFKRITKYDYKATGKEIYKKLKSNGDLNVLEFKQMIIAIEYMSYVYDIKEANFLKESIYNMIFDCYLLTCDEKLKKGSNSYYWSNSDHEFTISNKKDLKLSEIALLTKQKCYKTLDNGYMDLVSMYYLKAPLVWLRDEKINKKALSRFNVDEKVKHDLLEEFKHHIVRKNKYSDYKCESVEDYLSGFFVYDVQRFS